MYTQQRFVMMTLDPVHIGTGGYRLGRVDLSIAREPGTNLPKIPGTSLAGAARSYAAMQYEKLRCAGQGDKDEKQCGLNTCPICYTFGSIRGTEGGNAGRVSIADAQILFFPVHSMTGPVWVTTATRLNDAAFASVDPNVAHGKFATTLKDWNKALNLGWLLLEWQSSFEPPKLEEILRSAQNDKLVKFDQAAWDVIKKRLVLVDDGLFSQIVNSNLEVRTSVSIDPNTGAAKEGALFTYEALPRATWLWCDVVEDDYRDTRNGAKPFPTTTKQDGKPLGETWGEPLDVARSGLKLVEYLGIGGMGTRGFGRVKVMGDWEANHA